MTYSAEWNSHENKQRRDDAKSEQLERDWNRAKDGWDNLISRPFWWALALTIWIFVAVHLMEPKAY